jgi:P27 family predicted phage terminase small subunit
LKTPVIPKPPAYLSASTKRWWRSIVSVFVLESWQLAQLTLCAEQLDRANTAREVLAREGVTYPNRFGAPVKHPAVAIVEQAVGAFNRTLRELSLEGGAIADVRPPRARGGR